MRYVLLAFVLTFSITLMTGCKSTNSSTANSNDSNAKPVDANPPGTLAQASPGIPQPGSNQPGTNPAVDPTMNGVTPVDSLGTTVSMFVMDFHSARLRGDKTKLEAMLANDYKGTRADGSVVTKAQELASLKKVDDMLSMESQPAKVNGDTATVSSKITLRLKDKPEQTSASLQFTDTLRKRGDQWLITSSTAKKQ